MPGCANYFSLSLPFTNWLTSEQDDCARCKAKGMGVGKLTISSYKELACEVGKCVHSCDIDPTLEEAEQADKWMEVAVTKWNTGMLIGCFSHCVSVTVSAFLSLAAASNSGLR